MAALRVALDTFLICDPEQSRTTCNVFVANADESDRERLGRLFILTEIAPADPANQERIGLIQETINRVYYGATDRGIESAFEHALAEANARLLDLQQEEHRGWLTGLSIFVGVLKDDFFVYTHVGGVQGFLLRGTRILDLLHGAVEPAVNPLKVFSSVVSGQVEAGDHLVIATGSLLDYFSQEKIRRTVQAAPPSESAAYFDQLLRDNQTGTGFAAIILQLEPTLQAAKAEVPAAAAPGTGVATPSQPAASMDELIEKESATRELLQPSFWRSLTQLIRTAYHRAEDTVRTRLLRKPTRRRLAPLRRSQPVRPRSLLITALLWIWTLLKRLLLFVLMLLLSGVGALRKFANHSRSGGPHDGATVSERVAGIIRWILRLTRRQQIVLLAVVILTLALTQALFLYAGRDRTSLSREAQEQIVTTIREKTDEITTVLTYGDERSARRLLSEVEGLIAQLPSKRRADRALVDELTAALDGPKAQTRRLERPNLVEHATLAGLGTAEALQIVRAGNSRYVITGLGEIVDVTDEGAPKIVGAPLEDRTVTAAAADGSALLLLTADGLLRFTPASQQYSTPTVVLPNEPAALSTYRGRLYVIDRGGGQILRYARSGSGYSTSQQWLTDLTITLGDVVSFAIDGSIYVLREDGTVLELVGGERRDFTLDPIDPPLDSAAQLWTDELSDYLYVLSPDSNRLAVFLKNGALKVQYEDQSFASARGFVIDETESMGYVLSGGGSVVRFDLDLE